MHLEFRNENIRNIFVTINKSLEKQMQKKNCLDICKKLNIPQRFMQIVFIVK